METLAEKIASKYFGHEETEAEKIVKREKQLSTEHVKIDLLQAGAMLDIPQKVLDLIDMTERKINIIEEYRKSKNPRKVEMFPIGHARVLDVENFVEDIKCLSDEYINSMITKEITETIEMRLQLIFDRFLNMDECYIKYI